MGKHDIAWLVKACSDKFAVTRPSWNGRVVRLKYLGTSPYFYWETKYEIGAWTPYAEDLLAKDYQIVHPYPENSEDLFKDEYKPMHPSELFHVADVNDIQG
jgi:hypothetical protein